MTKGREEVEDLSTQAQAPLVEMTKKVGQKSGERLLSTFEA
jgi:hypothetical protein